MKSWERDYYFYLDNMDKFKFSGEKLIKPIVAANGKSAKICFKIYDSQGKLMPCKQPLLFSKILACKKSINMHLKMWAEGYGDLFIGKKSLLKEMKNRPKWVDKAFVELRYKRRNNEIRNNHNIS